MPRILQELRSRAMAAAFCRAWCLSTSLIMLLSACKGHLRGHLLISISLSLTKMRRGRESHVSARIDWVHRAIPWRTQFRTKSSEWITVRTSTNWWSHRVIRIQTLSGLDRLVLSRHLITCLAFQQQLNLQHMELSHPARGHQTKLSSAYIARSGNSLAKLSLIRKAAISITKRMKQLMFPWLIMFFQLVRTLSYRPWTCRMQSKSGSELSNSNWKNTTKVKLTQWTWMIWKILSYVPSMLLKFSIG